MMNILQLQNQLRNFSEEQLTQEMQRPTGQTPQFLLLNEIIRRKKMREGFDQSQGQDTTVMQDAMAVAGMPQAAAQHAAGAMAPDTDMQMNTGADPVPGMKGGGIVALQNGGPVRKMQEGGSLQTFVENGIQYVVQPDGTAVPLGTMTRMNRVGTFTPQVGTSGDLAPLFVTQADLNRRFADTETPFVRPMAQPDPFMPSLPTMPGLDDGVQVPMRSALEPSFTTSERPPTGEDPTRAWMDTPDSAYSEFRLATPQGNTDPRGRTFNPEAEARMSEERQGMLAPFTTPGAFNVDNFTLPAMPSREQVTGAVRDGLRNVPGVGSLFRGADALTQAARGDEPASELGTPLAVPADGSSVLPPGATLPAPTPAPLFAADAATSAPATAGGGSGSGSGGGGGIAAITAPAAAGGTTSDFEQEILTLLEDREKRAKQDKWLALAQAGMALMASRAPTMGRALGEAGMAGLQPLREGQASAEADRLGLLSTLEDWRMQQAQLAMQQQAMAMRGSGGGGGGGGGGGIRGLSPSQLSTSLGREAGILRSQLDAFDMMGRLTPDQRVQQDRLRERLDQINAQMSIINTYGGAIGIGGVDVQAPSVADSDYEAE
jgi:hypothetical protein